jgi:hypothetical protein
MKTLVGKFSFGIPDEHPDSKDPVTGEPRKIEKPFEYQQCDTTAEAEALLKEKKWSVLTFVNDTLKSNARSNAYQAALLPYKPSEVSPEEIRERMVRDYIRLNVPEAIARAQVQAVLDAMAKAESEKVSDEAKAAEVATE